ncbi:hypothetical protein AAES_67000 [Amazona aestiva]|uniref:Uncharacterized protein n=1 Tax=Amazona aestiva TaxID=12930 RepID=A0A0Q3Q3I7_AMAAE|nr:hypothetical protein AAES_67000 [Amazona aestiva]
MNQYAKSFSALQCPDPGNRLVLYPLENKGNGQANGASFTDPGGFLVTLNSPDGQFIMQGEVQCGMEPPFPVLMALGQQLWLIRGNEMPPVRT